MSKLQIKQIKLFNFKGFSSLDFDLENNNVPILGGKNGFGKTTIFDAIELVITGKISRYDDYKDFFDKRRSPSDIEIPLVNNKDVEDVRIELLLEDDYSAFWLKREAKVVDMQYGDPDFDVFNELRIRECPDESYKVMEQQDRSNHKWDSFAKHFAFINYIGQEEATSILKQKNSERAKQFDFLFDTKKIDDNINKVDNIQEAFNAEIQSCKQNAENLEEEIKRLTSNQTEENTEYQYYRLIANNSYYWDIENPQLNYNSYKELLYENGLLDSMEYYVRNSQMFQAYLHNMFIDKLLEENGNISDIVFYLTWRGKENLLTKYGRFIAIKNSIKHLSLESFDITLILSIRDVLTWDGQENTLKQIENLAGMMMTSYHLSDSVAKLYTELIDERNRMRATIDKFSVHDHLSECPLCGHRYDDEGELKIHIGECSVDIEGKIKHLGNDVNQMFVRLKEMIDSNVVNVSDAFFYEQKITEDIYHKYRNLNKGLCQQNMEKIRTELSIDLSLMEINEDTENHIIETLQERVVSVPEDIDYMNLSESYNSYIRYMDKKDITEDKIKAKRIYLTTQWNKTRSKLVQQNQAELDKAVDRMKKCDGQIKKLNHLLKSLKSKKNDYLTAVISDIEILFYIYSGRILQDSYFGRGLFIKRDKSKHRMIIVDRYDSDVDALFNMSSGQLVSIVFALVLSINKLYSERNFLAIDDPVQTIDDINMWGLIETLRHEFSNSFCLFSTHENVYGSLMRYKFEKWGISTRYFNLKDLRKNCLN